MGVSWAVTPEKVGAVVQAIVRVGHPRRIVMFGSAARGATGPHSDLDLLVITAHEVESPRRESVRLRRAVRDVLMPMDLLVISERRLREVADQPGLIYREALRHGKVVYDAVA